MFAAPLNLWVITPDHPHGLGDHSHVYRPVHPGRQETMGRLVDAGWDSFRHWLSRLCNGDKPAVPLLLVVNPW